MTYTHKLCDAYGFDTQRSIVERLGVSAPLVVDVGGNIGQSVDSYLRMFPEATVHSFEPHPDAFSQMVSRHARSDQVHCVPLALSDKPGEASFYAAHLTEVSSLLPPDPKVVQRSSKGTYQHTRLPVTVDTLDRYCERTDIAHIHVLKVDVQGAELDVLKGAGRLLAGGSVDLLFLEVMFAANYSGQSYMDDLWSFLKEHGYVLWDLFPFLHTRAGRLWTANAIFVSPKAADRIDPD